MQQQEQAPAISMSNTKKEMLTAYEEMKALLDAQESELADANAEKEKWRQQAASAAAERAESEDPVRRIHDLRSDIGRQLTELAGKFENETDEYTRLKQAVEDKKLELQRIYEVETAASDLTALIEANRKCRQDFERAMAEQREEFESDIESAKSEWEREKAEHEKALKEEKERKERERQREQEEYDYNLKRERDQRRNELEDEMAGMKKEMAAQREQFDRHQAEAEEVLSRREELVTEREKRMDDLQQQVDGFPQQLEDKVAAAVKQTTDRLQTEFAGREALLKKEFEGERNVLQGKIESLEKLVAAQEKRIDALTTQQERAYEKVQDIANKAVSSAGDRYAAWNAAERRSSSNNDTNH